MPAKLVKKLSGNSGCNVALYKEESGELFVRKTSKSAQYNSRLEGQAKKQISFNGKMLRTPRVLRTGMADGLFFFDMEFVKGVSLSKYLETVNIADIPNIVELLFCDLLDARSQNGFHDSSQQFHVFERKIKALEKELKSKVGDCLFDVTDYLLAYDWARFEESPCHGDFTTENILYGSDGFFYLIDFLDSFYDSWLLDVGTILQDVECMWMYRHQASVDNNTKIRLLVFKNYLIESIGKEDPRLTKDAYCALLLKLIRIVPYCENQDDLGFLKRKIALVFEKVKSL